VHNAHMRTHYIAVFEDVGPDHAVGVWFPDLPGCFSAGDTIEEALAKAPEAAATWLDALDGKPWPRSRPLHELRKDPEFIEGLKDFAEDTYFFVGIAVPSPLKMAAE
jgi:predicted RNase H-like HicB family nuclease